MLAVQLNAYGDPVDSVEVVDLPAPGAPGPGEVLLGLEYAPVNAADLIYRQLTVSGFFLGSSDHTAKFPALIQKGGALIAAGKLNVPVAATYPLSAIKQALAHVQKGGKVLLDIVGT